MSHLIDQRKILFWKKALNSDNTVQLFVHWLLQNRHNIGLIMSKYSVHSINIGVSVIKERIWTHFIDDCVNRGKVVMY